MNPAEPPPDLPEESPLVQTCAACGALIDVSGEYPLARIACPACGAEDLVDGRIDTFELQEIVGRGGMGVVYKAYDGNLDRFVAMKLLRLDKSMDATVVGQMAKEASITASINHPHVVRVFTTGTDRGRFFIAMELVDKGTLDQLINLQGRVGESQVLSVGIQISQGLRAAQMAGLIHRDVKPGNILFADAKTAKIVDFGLAIFMADEEKSRGEVWGTPYYVAPEKLENLPEDFRSDIYSLGGTLFHALAGRPPFEAEDASMVALKHLKSQAVSLQAFAPHVSSQTAYVINRTLAKDPNERYQSYDELIEHLEFARTQLEQNAANPQQKRRVVMEDESSQKMMGLITIAMVAILVLGGLGALIFRKQLFPNSNATPARTATTEKAVPPFQDAFDYLAAGDAARALELYRGHAANAKAAPYQFAWAKFSEGLAALAAGKADDARKAFREVVGRAPFTASDPKVAEFLVDTSRRLGSDRAIEPGEAGKLSPNNYQALGLFAFGLKELTAERNERAVELLRTFQKAEPAGRDAWIVDLKPRAAQFADEAAAFRTSSEKLAAAGTPAERRTAIAELQKIKGPLLPRVEALVNAAQPVPTSAAQPQEWRYVTQSPPDDWTSPDFNDGTWKSGKAPFGNSIPGTHTKWVGADIWMRREVTLPANLPANLAFEMYCDDDAVIYLNGVLAGWHKSWTSEYIVVPMTPEGRAALKKGRNVIAVKCHQNSGGQFIDVGIVAATSR